MYTEQFDRITHDPSVMGGKPCIRGMRVTVGMLVNQIGAGRSIEEILSEYPHIESQQRNHRQDLSNRNKQGAPVIYCNDDCGVVI